LVPTDKKPVKNLAAESKVSGRGEWFPDYEHHLFGKFAGSFLPLTDGRSFQK
jgi:hypothetical protein